MYISGYGVLDLVLAGSSGGVSLDAARLLDCNLGDWGVIGVTMGDSIALCTEAGGVALVILRQGNTKNKGKNKTINRQNVKQGLQLI